MSHRPAPKWRVFCCPKPGRLQMTELNKSIADMIDVGDDHFEFASAESVGEARRRGQRVSPRLGLRCRKINRSYALVRLGGKAVVVNEQPAGPVNDRVRVMSFESMNSWFANRYTEIVDRTVKSGQ